MAAYKKIAELRKQFSALSAQQKNLEILEKKHNGLDIAQMREYIKEHEG